MFLKNTIKYLGEIKKLLDLFEISHILVGYMRDFFSILNSICKKNLLTQEDIAENFKSYFLVLKFLSFLEISDPDLKTQVMVYLNNLNHVGFDNDYDSYLYLFHTFPQIDYPRFSYVKREKQKKDKDNDEQLTFLAETLELSKRECKYFIDNNYINLKQIKL